MNVEITIRELLIDSLSVPDPERIRPAAAQELGRLIAAGGLPPHLASGGTLPELPGLSFDASSQVGGEAIGLQIAQAIYGGGA